MSEREFTYNQLWGTESAIAQDRERIAQLRADDELRNGSTLPPPLPHVEFNLEKSSRASKRESEMRADDELRKMATAQDILGRESELLDWCHGMRVERDELREASFAIADHNTQLIEVVANKDETIAGLRSALDRAQDSHVTSLQECSRRMREMQKTIDEQDSQIENLFQQLQEADNRPY